MCGEKSEQKRLSEGDSKRGNPSDLHVEQIIREQNYKLVKKGVKD